MRPAPGPFHSSLDPNQAFVWDSVKQCQSFCWCFIREDNFYEYTLHELKGPPALCAEKKAIQTEVRHHNATCTLERHQSAQDIQSDLC